MTEAQRIAREERVAIMIHDGGCHENYAQKYCDKWPDVYGIRPVVATQEGLWADR